MVKNYKWVIAGVWMALSLTVFMQFTSVCPFLEAALFALSFFITSYLPVTILSKILLPKALKSKKIRAFAWQFVGFSFLLAFLHASFTKGFVWLEIEGVFPRSLLITATDRPFYAEYLGNMLSATVTNVAFCALRFFEEHYKMLQEHARLQQAHLEDELNLLRAQINPHLMFNVMNHIHILMKKNVTTADELLLRYSDVLRYQLYECNRETVLLEKEVDYLKDVIEVEKIRWGNELKVDCSWQVGNGQVAISPLLLIPFIENAFKHVSRLPLETGYVYISLRQEEETLCLSVKNSWNGQLPLRKKASGLGLDNVKKRLEILYPGKHDLAIRKEDGCYQTELRISL